MISSSVVWLGLSSVLHKWCCMICTCQEGGEEKVCYWPHQYVALSSSLGIWMVVFHSKYLEVQLHIMGFEELHEAMSTMLSCSGNAFAPA